MEHKQRNFEVSRQIHRPDMPMKKLAMKSVYTSVDLNVNEEEEERDEKELADEACINVVEIPRDEIGEDEFFDVIEHKAWYVIVFRKRTIVWILFGVVMIFLWFYWTSTTWLPVGNLSLDDEPRHVMSSRIGIVLSNDGRTMALLSATPISPSDDEDDANEKETGRVRLFKLSSSKRWDLKFDSHNYESDTESVMRNASSIALSGDASLVVFLDQSSDPSELITFQRSPENSAKEEWRELATANDGNSNHIANAMAMSADGSRMIIETKNDDSGKFSVQVVQFNGEDSTWNPVASHISYHEKTTRLAISSDGRRVLVGSSSDIKIYEQPSDGSEAWNVIGIIDSGFESEGGDCFKHLRAVAMAHDGQRIAYSCKVVINNSTTVRTTVLEDNNDGGWKPLGVPVDVENTATRFPMAFSGDGEVLAVTEESSAVRVFRFQNGIWSSYGRTIIPDGTGDPSDISLSLSFNGDRVGVAASSYGEKDSVRVFQF